VPGNLLVLATSARVIAEGLAAAGRDADVIDCFADADCQAVARRCVALPCAGPDDFSLCDSALLPAVQRWTERHPQGQLMLGSGFEHRPELIEALAALAPLLANRGPVVASCKNPQHFAAVCAAEGLVTPELAPPGCTSPGPWLAKRTGATGGSHVRPSDPANSRGRGTYWQRWIAGLPVSLLFLATDTGAAPLGVHHQCLAPTAGAPFRFGGVVAAPDLDPRARSALSDAARRLTHRFGLRGLNGLDALWDGQTLWLLEINPRPPASLALHAGAVRGRLLQAHIECFAARASRNRAGADRYSGAGDPLQQCESAPQRAGAAGEPRTDEPPWQGRDGLNPGMAVVYASRLLSIPADFRFPPGCHDRPTLPRTFAAGEPVCSVQVAAGGVEKLRTLIGILRERLLPVAGAESLSSL
jgi:predicted ATP-grasp superfamily ATP-dependent carboligase